MLNRNRDNWREKLFFVAALSAGRPARVQFEE